MDIHYWLNFKDYTQFQLSIALVGSFLWVMVYFFLIKDTIQKKFIEMPFFIACGNFAWEILYAYVYDGYINLGQIYVWGYRAWFFLDIFIFFLLLRYGNKQTDNDWISKNFKKINLAALSLFLVFFYVWIEQGFDNTPIHGNGSVKLGATSAYLLNFGITCLYLVQFYKHQKKYQFSKPIAWCKAVGTGLFTILFWQIDPENYIVQTLGVLVFLGDCFYIGLLYKFQKPVKIKGNFEDYTFPENKKFDALWQTNPSYLIVKNKQLRYFKTDLWNYTSPDGKYETRLSVLEGNILIETARGEVDLENARMAFRKIKRIVKQLGLEKENYYYISDARGITKASFKVRELVIDFHTNNPNLKKFVLITNAFTRVLLKLMTPINPDVINNWFTSDSVENGVVAICNADYMARSESDELDSRIEKRINDAYNIISKISLKQFDKIEEIQVSESDPFHGIFTALKILKNDQKEIVQELNNLLNDSREELKEQELHFKQLFENSYEIIFVIDNNDILVNYNKGAKAYWAEQGMDLQVGYNIYNYILDNHAQFYRLVKKDLLKGSKREFELELKDKSGKTLWLHCKSHPVKISDTKIFQVFQMNDITHQIEMQQEKEIMGHMIQYQKAQLNEFSNIVSQDLRRHTTSMVSAIENLRNSLTYTSVNVFKVTALRKALDDLEGVIGELDKVLNHPDIKMRQNQSNLFLNRNNNFFE